MPQAEKLGQLIAELDRVEREELLLALSEELLPENRGLAHWMHRLAALEHPLIVSSPGVCGGAARLIRTRIPVWVLERMRQVGVSESDILRSYPILRAADLVQAWSYAAGHPAEIEQAIRENEVE